MRLRNLIAVSVAGLTLMFGPWATAGWSESVPQRAVAEDDLPTVQNVDIGRYMGRWYEVASLPQSFQKGCFATMADYRLKTNGRVEVINSCRRGGLDGEVTVAKGRARVVDRQTNAKLKVMFQWPFEGDYWILALDTDYQHVLVGTPDRESLWVLSRSVDYDQTVVNGFLDLAEWYGFDVTALNWTLHR